MAIFNYCGADGKLFKGMRTPPTTYAICKDPLKPQDSDRFLPCQACPLYLAAEWRHYGDPLHDPKTRQPLNSIAKRRLRGTQIRAAVHSF